MEESARTLGVLYCTSTGRKNASMCRTQTQTKTNVGVMTAATPNRVSVDSHNAHEGLCRRTLPETALGLVFTLELACYHVPLTRENDWHGLRTRQNDY